MAGISVGLRYMLLHNLSVMDVRILVMLMDKQLTLHELAERHNVGYKAIHHHVRKLEQVGAVRVLHETGGRNVYGAIVA